MNTEITDIINPTLAGRRCSVAADRNVPALGALGWIVGLLPAALALSLGNSLPAYVWMWVIALALFLGAKWITIRHFLRSGSRAGLRRLLEYALLWPGMDVRAFCGNAPVPPPLVREWALGAMKTGLGAVVIWFGVPLMRPTHPLITGWVGMIGIVLLLHFGLFHLLSLLWRARGIDACPMMHSPGAATSLSGFWGSHWNSAFSELTRENLFKPLARHLGARRALLLVFLISGGLHELVISVPARGGYGLPTAYFVLQGLALSFERSKSGRRLGIRSGLRGWCFVVLVAGAPAFRLFHPVFIHHVILPMLQGVGAT